MHSRSNGYAEVMEALVDHSCGKLRELQNFIERSVILANGNTLRPPIGEWRQTTEMTLSSR